MVQIAAAFVATTLFLSSALASSPDYYRRESYSDDIFDRDVDVVTREDVEMIFQRSLELADSLEEREPFFGAIFGAIRGISAAVKGIRAAKAAKKGISAAKKAHSAHNQHQNHKNNKRNKKHRRELEDELEEREINDELYDELD